MTIPKEGEYWFDKGKYQKNYDYFWKKLVPPTGQAKTEWGEVLRRLAKFYYRAYNDGDDYDQAVDMGASHIVPKNGYKSKDVEKVAVEIERMLRRYRPMSMYERDLNKATDHLLRAMMLHYSTKDKIWNPETNRLVKIESPTGLKAMKLLGCKLTYKCEDSK